jgi:ribosome-interacting GTPase 1
MTQNLQLNGNSPLKGVEILFDGNKPFWKTRTNINVVMVMHTNVQTIEVIGHHPDLDTCSRFYVSSVFLATKIDQNDMQEKINEMKEGFIRQKKPFNARQLSREVLISAMNQFLLSRLQYSCNEESGTFTVYLQPTNVDVVVDNDLQLLDVIVSQPSGLPPYQAVFQKKLR